LLLFGPSMDTLSQPAWWQAGAAFRWLYACPGVTMCALSRADARTAWFGAQNESAVSSEDVGTPRRRGGRFEREAAQFAAFRREWGLKLAKALAAAFSKSAQGYRLNLDAFASAAEG
jgi:hypothetical protein